ncbi:MAG TPA: hypothetical protein VFK21_13480 [Gammaproteobacteria bacterium]|nr:hypothetical protein [Gammaproteobacteria bacterium]
MFKKILIANRGEIACLSLLLGGCASQLGHLPAVDTSGAGTTMVRINPDNLQVDPAGYPEFHAVHNLSPNREMSCVGSNYICDAPDMIPIETTDTWVVTHIFEGKYLIESKGYTQREYSFLCGKKEYKDSLGTCLATQYNYGIYIDPDGKIDGGWQLLPAPNIVLASDRVSYMDANPAKNAGWPGNFYFIPSNKKDKN